MPILQGPFLVALAAAAVVVFVIAAAYLRRDPQAVRATYYCTVCFAALLVGLSALGGLAHAAGAAIANPNAGFPCRDVRPAGFADAQGPPAPPTSPEFVEPTFPPMPSFPPGQIRPIPFPTMFPVPQGPARPAYPFNIRPQCDAHEARGAAAPEAIRSGILLIVAAVLVQTHGSRMRRLLKGAD